MPKPYIYRVETPTGLGPWCDENGNWAGGAGTDWCHSPASLHHHANEWLKKKKDEGDNNWRFGFLSLDQLFKYMHSSAESPKAFDKLFDRMVKSNLVISVYNVNHWDYPIGDITQCIFDKKKANIVAVLHPKSSFIQEELARYFAYEERMFYASA